MSIPDAPEPPEPNLDADALMAAATAETGLDDFGPPGVRDDLAVYLRAVLEEANLSPMGLMGLQGFVQRVLVNRLRFHGDLKRHPEILDEDGTDPIIITGLFRTGTTKLQRMMSADPGVQGLTFWRILNPAPFPDAGPGEPDPRIAMAEEYVSLLEQYHPEFIAGHPWQTHEPDEDSLLLWMTFAHLSNAGVGNVPSYVDRVRTRPQRPNYDYLRMLTQYLQWQDGGKRGRPWVLKSPTHIGNLEAIFEAFPNATLVHCHRDPVVVTASFARLFELFWGLFGSQVPLDEIGPILLRLWSSEMDGNLDQRDRLGQSASIVDVRYDDIVDDPVAVLGGIYDRHGRSLTAEGTEAMQRWAADNPQHRFGKHQYTLEACGLTEEEIRSAFARYLDRFGPLLGAGT